MHRPAHLSDEDWAEFQQLQDDHDDLTAQLADREAQIEHGVIDSYDAYEFDFGPLTPRTSSPAPWNPRPFRRARRLHPPRPSALTRRPPAPDGISDRPDRGAALQHPDFELYDNVGRTADQIHAYHTRSATRDDLRRWADRDAAAFRTRHPLAPDPFPAPDLSPFREALDAAGTPAEFSTVLNALLEAVNPFLNEVIEYLAATAQWKGQNRGAEPESPPWLLRGAASSIASALAMATEADWKILRADYDPPPDVLVKGTRAPGVPPAPPGPQSGVGGPRR